MSMVEVDKSSLIEILEAPEIKRQRRVKEDLTPEQQREKRKAKSIELKQRKKDKEAFVAKADEILDQYGGEVEEGESYGEKVLNRYTPPVNVESGGKTVQIQIARIVYPYNESRNYSENVIYTRILSSLPESEEESTIFEMVEGAARYREGDHWKDGDTYSGVRNRFGKTATSSELKTALNAINFLASEYTTQHPQA